MPQFLHSLLSVTFFLCGLLYAGSCFSQSWNYRLTADVGGDLSRFSLGRPSGQLGVEAAFRLSEHTDFLFGGMINRREIYHTVPNDYCEYGPCLQDGSYLIEYELRRDMAGLNVGMERRIGSITVGLFAGRAYVIGQRTIYRHTFDPGGNGYINVSEDVSKSLGENSVVGRYIYAYDSRWAGVAGAKLFWGLNAALDVGLSYSVSMTRRRFTNSFNAVNDVPPYQPYTAEVDNFKAPARSLMLSVRWHL